MYVSLLRSLEFAMVVAKGHSSKKNKGKLDKNWASNANQGHANTMSVPTRVSFLLRLFSNSFHFYIGALWGTAAPHPPRNKLGWLRPQTRQWRA